MINFQNKKIKKYIILNNDIFLYKKFFYNEKIKKKSIL